MFKDRDLYPFSRCQRPADAFRVFDGLLGPDVVSWNAVLFGYVESGDGDTVLELFQCMQDEGYKPDMVTYVAVLKACATSTKTSVFLREKWLMKGKAVHSQVSKAGFDRDIMVASILVDLYSSSGALSEARQVFEKMAERDVVSWNAVIFGHVENGESRMALELFNFMKKDGCTPNALTYVAVMKACGSLSVLETGKAVHAKIHVAAGAEKVTFIATSLVDFYGKCGLMNVAQHVFDSVNSRHLPMWNVLVAGYSDQGDSFHAFMLFDKMCGEHLPVDRYTFLSVLSLCSRVELVERAKDYLEAMQNEHFIRPQIEHYNCMVDLFCRAYRLKDAVDFVKKLEPDIAFWKTILGACHKWNNVEVGKLAFDSGVELDDQEPVLYVLMTNIYANAGMVVESAEVQALEKQVFGQATSFCES